MKDGAGWGEAEGRKDVPVAGGGTNVPGWGEAEGRKDVIVAGGGTNVLVAGGGTADVLVEGGGTDIIRGFGTGIEGVADVVVAPVRGGTSDGTF